MFFFSVFGSVEPASVDLLDDLVEIWAGELPLHGDNIRGADAHALETFSVSLNLFHLVGHDLVDDRADDLDACGLEQGLVQGDLVDGVRCRRERQ